MQQLVANRQIGNEEKKPEQAETGWAPGCGVLTMGQIPVGGETYGREAAWAESHCYLARSIQRVNAGRAWLVLEAEAKRPSGRNKTAAANLAGRRQGTQGLVKAGRWRRTWRERYRVEANEVRRSGCGLHWALATRG